MSSAADIARKVGLNLLERAVAELPELVGIIHRGLATEPDTLLADEVRERLPEEGESAKAARELREKQGGGD